MKASVPINQLIKVILLVILLLFFALIFVIGKEQALAGIGGILYYINQFIGITG